jgi:hypothetical protein
MSEAALPNAAGPAPAVQAAIEGRALFDNTIERAHWATLGLVRRKRLGQFWTPYAVARFMAAWLTPTEGEICDPAAGAGVFARALLDPARPIGRGRTLRALDLDPGMTEVVSALARRLPDMTLVVESRDYFELPGDMRFGAVIVNPPYLNHADIAAKAGLAALVSAETGLRPSGLSNLYIYFLVRLAKQLSAGGRMAAIVPAEFLDSTYGRAVKRHLLRTDLLRAVVSFGSGASIFEGAMTTATILLLENNPRPGRHRPVAFRQVEDEGELAAFESLLASSPFDPAALGTLLEPDPLRPWRPYVSGLAPLTRTGYVPLGELAVAQHGFTTGDNSFFLRRASELAAAQLSKTWCTPTDGRSSYVPGPFFRASDLATLDTADRAIWLLTFDASSAAEPAAEAYLSSAAAQAAAARPSARGRRPWWRQARRIVAPVWISNLSRGRVKVVRNETRAMPLDHFHTLAPRPELSELAARALVAYTGTTEFATSLRTAAREYGSGMLKIETREMLEVAVLDVRRLSDAMARRVIAADDEWRTASTDRAAAAHAVLDTLFAKRR